MCVYMFMSVHMSGDQRLTSGVVLDRVTIVVMKNHGQSNPGGKGLFHAQFHITRSLSKAVRAGTHTGQEPRGRS